MIRKFFPKISFVGIYGEQVGIPKKPDSVAALELSLLMDLKSNDIVYIGDPKIDMKTGKNAGIDKVGASWGFMGYSEIQQYGADYIAKIPDELLNLF